MVEGEEGRDLVSQVDDMSSDVKEIKDALTSKKDKKKKRFSLPFGITFGAKSKLKKNYVLVFNILSNGEIDLKFLQIKNEMVYLQRTGTYHKATGDYIGRYKQYPVMILPEWSVEPISFKDHQKETEERGESSSIEPFLLKVLEESQIKPKMGLGSLGGKGLLWILLAGCAVLYFITKMMGVS